MPGGLKQVRTALRHGDVDAALVELWNAVEPARIAGDRGALRAIERYASAIARGGDESQAREAERLLEVLRGAVAEGAAEAAATAQLGAEVRAGGFEGMPTGGTGMGGEEEEQQQAQASGIRWGTIVWLLILIAIVVVNVLGQRE